jgi:hypothetical protein
MSIHVQIGRARQSGLSPARPDTNWDRAGPAQINKRVVPCRPMDPESRLERGWIGKI